MHHFLTSLCFGLFWVAAFTACSTSNSAPGPTSRPAGRNPRGVARPAPDRRNPNLVTNGDFSAGLAHWELSGKGAVVDDPKQPGNPVLRIEQTEDLFGIEQALTVPDGTTRLSLHFRVMATAVSEDAPIGLRMRIYDQDGSSGFNMWVLRQAGTWIEIDEIISDFPDRPVSLVLENNFGTGALLIDDLEIRVAP